MLIYATVLTLKMSEYKVFGSQILRDEDYAVAFNQRAVP